MAAEISGRAAPALRQQTAERALLDDVGVFAEQYVACRAEVFRFVLFKVGDRHLAEDITSETFLRAFRARKGYTPTGSGVQAWLITIARNLVADHYRSARVQREALVADSTVLVTTNVASAEVQVLEELAKEPVLRALTSLPATWRQPLLLQYWAGWSHQRIAQAMGSRSRGAVKALRQRALVRLRERLAEEGAAS
ncbi:RNA polymerase sigma factor [Streptomyces lavendulocolor]|uniref:RNA polymerase sigma factor n=1 Tax=Streptomyces lavendulocolor TaxID=67316 RepID=UPI003C2B4827